MERDKVLGVVHLSVKQMGFAGMLLCQDTGKIQEAALQEVVLALKMLLYE